MEADLPLNEELASLVSSCVHPKDRAALDRNWFYIDGKLYALNENGTTIDVHGNEKVWSGVSILPDGVTLDDLIQARDKYTYENGDYD